MAFSFKERIEKIKQRKAAGGKKTSAGSGKFKPSKGNKFVLFIGDEGTILVYMKDGTVQSRQFVPDANEQSLNEFRQTLAKDKKASIVMVLDTIDQTYLQQTLPPVSSFSVNKLIRRRLEREFGSVEIKGALTLGRETTGRKDWNFIMIAVEKNPQLVAWLEFVEELPNHFRGIRLVSVESENIVKFIDKAAHLNTDGAKHKWKFFVSHNKVGGFRQVILKDGRIVFTRLAQPIGESNIEMIAGNIEQEMQSTIEYMKRLSFNAQEGLDIYIVASSGIKAAIDQKKFSMASMHIYTPYELAECMGIEGATQPTDQFGDVILAATIGSSRKYVLPFATTHSKQVDQYRQLLAMQRMVGAACGVGIIGYVGVLGVGMFTMSQEASDMEDKMRSQRSRMEVLRQEIGRSEVDIEKANDLLELYLQLQQEKFSPHVFFGMLLPIKQSPVWVKKITWEMVSATKNEGLLVAVGKSGMKAEVQLEFEDVINDSKVFKLASKKMLENMKSWLPGYEVLYSALPAAFTEQTALQTSIDTEGETENVQSAQTGPVEATVLIKAETLQPTPPNAGTTP